MKVFLTGGSGLLGKHLESELDNRGIEHYSPTHAAFDVIEQRLGEVIRWLDFKPDVVIHCAAKILDTYDKKLVFHSFG